MMTNLPNILWLFFFVFSIHYLLLIFSERLSPQKSKYPLVDFFIKENSHFRIHVDP